MAPRKTKAKAKEESALLTALRFIQVAQAETGTPNQTHCHIVNGQIVAYDGILAAGCLLTEQLPHICPNTYKLIAALERARGALSITQMDNSQMLFKSDKLKAVVPCIDPNGMMYIAGDQPNYPLNDLFRRAGVIAGALTREGAQSVQLASLLTRNGSLVGTNNAAVIEAWHGVATPPGLIIPKTFFDTLAKIAKPIVRFGYSEQSFTVWFEDQSWLRTQLYSESWPNVDAILSWTEGAVATDIPKEFVEAINAVSSFSDDSRIYFGDGAIRSHAEESLGAVYVCKGIPDGVTFNYKYLLAVAPHMQTADFVGNDRAAIFFGKDDAVQIRGALSKMTPAPVNTYTAPPAPLPGYVASAGLDAEIPF